ncbi:predicted protein [Naegleria gruberi]|uniref:Predicted protein n=1 Tax=Naegleria gruberi TaxID=5762 RepID=D2VD03_NAEGR|nr:uncharacterized protein NAEGRDRAFT_66750 [Naegleria gruberi]EFC45511.1 predicted protein [Naegleria gruberi]|eukprot:XP_002678255.1 predicted protein [Naegleria gruberi strain NEG-M]
MKPTKQFKGLINYKPSSSNSRHGSTIEDDSSSTTDDKDNKQRIEFVHHKLTSLLLRLNDLVLIIVPEEFEILQTLDPMLHGKVGTIVGLGHFDEDECEDLVQIEIENKKTNSIDHTITHKQCETVSVPKFCVCLKAEVFNERKERYLSQRRARSYDALSTSSTTSSTVSDISLTSLLSTTRSLSPECFPSNNLSSLLVSPSKQHTSSPPTTSNTTNSCSPKYSLGPKKTTSILNRQKRFHSSATAPPPLLSSTSTFFQSSTTTQAVGNNKRPLSSPGKTSKKSSYQFSSTNSQFSSKHDTDNDVDMRDNFLSQSVPKYINSFMLSDFESSNIFSADIPSEKVNRQRRVQDIEMTESSERVS